MKCYKCGSFLYDGEYCSNCGADVAVYREIVLKSNDFYNSALEYARDRNLSRAIEHLKLSLKLYKGNVNSHNLLGLLYFETGEYTLGFAHWVISKNIQPENNLASIFLDQMQEDKAYFESLDSNIKKYNKAIAYVEQESYDLAEIQLKKLLNDDSVHMVSAYQLSALLKIRKKKYAAARKILSRAQAIDAGNPMTIAMNTFVNGEIKNEEKELTPGELKTRRQQEKTEGEQHTPLSGDDVIIPKTTYKDYNPATVAVIQLLIGFLVGAALIFFIVVPAKTNAVRNESAKERTELEERVSELTEENARLLNGTQAAAAAENTQAAPEEGGQAPQEQQPQKASPKASEKDLQLLMSAYDSFQNGNDEACGNTLYEIEHPENFEGSDKILYDSIKYTIDRLPDIWYEQAVEEFEENHFPEALEYFTKVYEVQNTTGESLYYMGLCYYNMDEDGQAAARFREYMETYPNGDHYNECEYLLSMTG